MGKVSVIGLGAMGSALAGAFLDRGHEVTVWNRSAGKAAPLVARGAVHAPSVADAVTAGEVTVVCVLDYAAAGALLEAAGGVVSGRTLVNLTNGTPVQARALAVRAEELGARYLDGGIMAVPPMIGGADAFLLYSGSRDAFETHRDLLSGLGAATYLGSDAGLASVHDLALLAAMYGLFTGFLQSAAMVGAEKVRASDFLPLLMPWLRAMTEALPEMARQIDERDYVVDGGSNLAMQAVALDNIVEAARAGGVGTELVAPMRALVRRRVADGFGADDLSGLVELLRP